MSSQAPRIKDPRKQRGRKPPGKNLRGDEQLQVLQKIAMFVPKDEIVKWAAKNLSRPIKARTVEMYKKGSRYEPLIKKYREEFNSKMFEVEYASKRRRVEALEDVYKESRTEGDRAHAISALQAIQDEVEGKRGAGNLHIHQYNQYNNMTDEEIDKRRLELLDKVLHYKKREEITVEPLKEIENGS